MMKVKDSYPYRFILLYSLIYMGNAIYNTFLPVYLNSIGFSRTITGTLMAMGPFVALVAQPVWGIVGDRAKTKNRVLKLLLFGSAVFVSIYPLTVSLYYLFGVIAVFTFFQASIVPTSDAITLEYLETTRWKFGPIRMAGTLGFAVMSVIAGNVLSRNINNMFIMYPAALIVTFFIAAGLPAIRGHQSEGKRVSIWVLLKNHKLMILMAFNFIIQISLGFYYSFFPIYFKQMGGSNALLGWVMFISAVSEVPFLLFADKILKKIGVVYTLIGSAVVTAIRWLILHSVVSAYMVLPAALLHGLTFIVFSYSLATYINKEVPRELRASGQAINALIGMSMARIIGSIFGGYFSDMIGIKQMFFYISMMDFAAVIILGSILFFRSRCKEDDMSVQY